MGAMKFKEILFMLGLRPSIKSYPHKLIELTNPQDGTPIQWAQWLHPKTNKILPSFNDLSLLNKILSPGDLAIDIGAHIGDTTIPIAVAVGSSGLVIALEPNPATFKILEVNADKNQGVLNICPLNAAAMESDGEFEFHYNDPGLANGGYRKGYSFLQIPAFFSVKVKGINVSKYLIENYPDRLDKLRYIKTDCEGHDYSVFKSLKPLVIKARPFIRMEIFDQMDLSDQKKLHAELTELNYRVYKIELADEVQFSLWEQASIKKEKSNFDILAVPAEKAFF